ncbi:MAG: hypothetical protein JOZ55_00720, partial [Alphaproteobacteria bacterium]|nr:hypothetical protein [Alphaproteobacteria bacterium]
MPSIGALALAFAAGLWALSEQSTSRRLRRSLRTMLVRLHTNLGEREALIDAGREALLVWSRDRDASSSYGGAEETIDSCLAGEDAVALSEALDALGSQGKSFALVARDRDGSRVHMRGRAVGAMA